MKRFDPAFTPDPGETPETDRALHWLQTANAKEDVLAAISSKIRVRNRRRRALQIGGSAAAAVLAAILWLRPQPTRIDGAGPATRTATATFSAPRQQLLPDGSVVELNEGAEVSHAFTDSVRRVTLVHGEAHFRVAKNPFRPFVVTAGGVSVRAVGTAFSVHLDSAGVEVLVSEGKVAVEKYIAEPSASSPAAAPSEVATALVSLLTAGGRALISTPEVPVQVSTLPAAELTRRLAWRVPQLEFSRTPLVEVVELINAHNGTGTRLAIDPDSPALETIKLSGFLSADNTEGLVRLLQANFQVQAEANGTTIVLHKRH